MDDQAAIGAVVDAMYAMVSGPAGPRDWSRQPDAFHPDARQMRTGVDEAGAPLDQDHDAWELSRRHRGLLRLEADFFEVEVARRIDIAGEHGPRLEPL